MARTQAQKETVAVKPNIVFILTDNTGWGDWGVYGGPTPTPNIDRLAAEGMRFLNYNVESQCTPTRAAILTGRHPIRSGTYNVLPPSNGGPMGMTPWEYTIADLLSESGYATALYGKWHLGEIQGRLPNDQGFDEWWGIPNSSDESAWTTYALYNEMVAKVLEEEGVSALLNTPPHVLEGKKGEESRIVMDFDMKVRSIIDGDHLVPKTADYIKRNAAANQPFFVYLGYTQLHPPIECHPDFAGTSPERGGVYADCIAEMDHRVGELMDAVVEAGVEDDTIFILSSDNATSGLVGNAGGGGGSNGPFRGNFFCTPYEGSMRVPAIIRWPGRIPAGAVTNEIIAAVDWLPTLATLTGRPDLVPTDRPIDGVDFSKLLLGEREKSARESYLFFGVDGQLMSIKWRYYKMILRTIAGSELDAVNKGPVDCQLPQFFDLSSDPHEDHNLWHTTLTMTWVFGPMLQAQAAFNESTEKYPNIPPGTTDFKGYPAGK